MQNAVSGIFTLLPACALCSDYLELDSVMQVLYTASGSIAPLHCIFSCILPGVPSTSCTSRRQQRLPAAMPFPSLNPVTASARLFATLSTLLQVLHTTTSAYFLIGIQLPHLPLYIHVTFGEHQAAIGMRFFFNERRLTFWRGSTTVVVLASAVCAGRGTGSRCARTFRRPAVPLPRRAAVPARLRGATRCCLALSVSLPPPYRCLLLPNAVTVRGSLWAGAGGI